MKYLQGSLLQEKWLLSFFLNEILVICWSWWLSCFLQLANLEVSLRLSSVFQTEWAISIFSNYLTILLIPRCNNHGFFFWISVLFRATGTSTILNLYLNIEHRHKIYFYLFSPLHLYLSKHLTSSETVELQQTLMSSTSTTWCLCCSLLHTPVYLLEANKRHSLEADPSKKVPSHAWKRCHLVVCYLIRVGRVLFFFFFQWIILQMFKLHQIWSW